MSIGTTLLALIFLGLVQVGKRAVGALFLALPCTMPDTPSSGLHDEAEPPEERTVHVSYWRRVSDQ
jgi:hypothetical protein